MFLQKQNVTAVCRIRKNFSKNCFCLIFQYYGNLYIYIYIYIYCIQKKLVLFAHRCLFIYSIYFFKINYLDIDGAMAQYLLFIVLSAYLFDFWKSFKLISPSTLTLKFPVNLVIFARSGKPTYCYKNIQTGHICSAL